jgi:hypothetical protein
LREQALEVVVHIRAIFLNQSRIITIGTAGMNRTIIGDSHHYGLLKTKDIFKDHYIMITFSLGLTKGFVSSVSESLPMKSKHAISPSENAQIRNHAEDPRLITFHRRQ